MKTNLIITDNFYNNPDETREWALKQEFGVVGNFPGQRTPPVGWPGLRKSIQDIVRHAAGNITRWDTEYTETFQYTTKKDSSWIHADYTTMWAGVLYLTPNAPAQSGTGIYRHKPTGIYEWDRVKDSPSDFNNSNFLGEESMDQWEQVNFVGNIYNRLVIYKGSLYHRSVLPGFGTDKYTGRLFQTFFFDTE